MTTIRLTTEIHAPAALVFDLSRDIGLHSQSASQTRETAIAGRTSGLIEKGETVTWRGRHFGLWQTHKSLITELQYPDFFVDEMVEGRFKSFRHEHHVRERDGMMVMEDILSYETPYGWMGHLFDRFVLKRHMTDFLRTRNAFLKSAAEQQAGQPPEHRQGLDPE